MPLLLTIWLCLAAASHADPLAARTLAAETVHGAGLVAGPEADSGWTIEPLDASYSVAGMVRVVVHNPWGEVRIRRNDTALVRLVGNAQRPDDADYSARFEFEPVDGELHIEPQFVRTSNNGSVEAVPMSELAELSPRRRIDMTLLLPEGIDLRAEVLDDLIEARGLHCDLEVHSRDGNLDLATSGRLVASSRNGRILADLSGSLPTPGSVTGQATSKTASFKTGSGDIYLWFDWLADASVQVDTAGRITSDVSIDIERRDQSLRKIAHADIGSHRPREDRSSAAGTGKPGNRGTIVIESLNGDVHLLVHTP
jgi:hypothetical protein